MTEYPWEKSDGKQATPPLDDIDPLMFVRLRIQHGDTVRSVGIRADDKDITGRIKLDDGSEIVISSWGVPTQREPFLTSMQVMQEIIKYVNEKGLQIRKPST
jgi:hypothetical protein